MATARILILLLLILLLLPILAGSVAGRTISVPHSEPDIEAALLNATEGDTILIAGGYQLGTIHVQKNVTISGLGRPLVPFDIVGGGYRLTPVRQSILPEYYYLSYGLIIVFDPQESSNRTISLRARIPIEDVPELDPLSIGFYRLDTGRIQRVSTTYAVEHEVRVNATIPQDKSGTYAILGKRRFPFGPAIQGITLIALAAAGVLALFLSRGKRRAVRTIQP